MALIGKKDAWALATIGAGAMAANPLFAGDPHAFPALALPAVGASWFAWKRAREWLDRTDLKSREGFILPSDERTKEHMLDSAGLRFGYTQDENYPVDIEDDLLMRHTAIVGQSGVGKTTLGEFLLWQQAARGGGFIFIDAKLDAKTRNRMGHMMDVLGRSDDFYVLNVDDPDNSNTYAPILSGDADEFSDRLLNLLPLAENNPGADYYRQSSGLALTVIGGALKAAKRRYHMADIGIIMQSARALSELERITPSGSPERRNLQVFLDQYRKRTPKEGVQIDVNRLKEVLGGTGMRIAKFAQGKFGRVFNTYAPEIDLTDIVMNNKCLYVMLPTMGKSTSAFQLGKLILSDLRTAVYNVQASPESKRPSPPFFVLADELGSYVMTAISTLFEQARSANIMLAPAFQSFSQLTSVSRELSSILIQNTWSKVFFKYSDDEGAEKAADIIGMSKRFARSLSASENEGTSASASKASPLASKSSGAGLSESYREVEEHRVSSEQLKALGMGECIVMRGPRVYHIKSPMIKWPQNLPDYKVLRRHTEIPPDEQPLNFEARHKEFLMSAEDALDED